MKPRRELHPDVYDALELSALAFGGIGARNFDDYDGTPFCAYGHGRFVENSRESGDETWDALVAVRLYSGTNDDAVASINIRSGRDVYSRVPFDEWCKELNVVRGKA